MARPVEHRYRLYGCVVSSEVPLGLGPIASHARAGVRSARPAVRLEVFRGSRGAIAWFHSIRSETGRRLISLGRSQGHFVARIHGRADFHLSPDGRRVRFRALDRTLTGEALGGLFLAQALPLALTLTGRWMLHGSAVLAGGGAVAFVGSSGRGKSSLASALVRRGHAFVSDDALCVVERGGKFLVLPGPPESRLRSDTDRALWPRDGRPRAAKEKCRRPVARHAGHRPVALKAICLLQPPRTKLSRPRWQPVSSMEGLTQLLTNSFRLNLGDSKRLGREVALLTRMLEALPVRRLTVPKGLRRLARTAGMVAREIC